MAIRKHLTNFNYFFRNVLNLAPFLSIIDNISTIVRILGNAFAIADGLNFSFNKLNLKKTKIQKILKYCDVFSASSKVKKYKTNCLSLKSKCAKFKTGRENYRQSSFVMGHPIRTWSNFSMFLTPSMVTFNK